MVLLFDFAEKERIIQANEEAMSQDGFWNDPKKAQSLIQVTNGLKSLKEKYDRLKASLEEVDASLDELKQSFDE